MNYAIEQRMRFIDFLLNEYGHINRSTLMNYFGIGSATATRDFKIYRDMNPGSMTYDSVHARYYRTIEFKAHFQ